jgi:S1-C subfamily serine protease
VYCVEDYNQGTGFELEGFGLITCAHVLVDSETGQIATDITLTQPRLGGKRINARIVQLDRDRDLAILAFDEPSGVLLQPKLGAPSIGQQIRAAGFPEHAPSHTIWEDHGTITGYWHHLGSPRYLITVRVAGGASGGPVFDATGAVIGVISHGEASIERAVQGVRTRFGMIPLSMLAELPTPTDAAVAGDQSD